jgi:hypothetical protein
MSTIRKVMCRDDKNFATIHVICDDGSFHLGMKTEHKYSELTVFVFYIIKRFYHEKLSVSIGFTTIFNHFLYSLIAKCRNIPN